jgi:selenocysteine lyase/cysteine desulfurase
MNRREFLASGTSGLAATTLPATVLPARAGAAVSGVQEAGAYRSLFPRLAEEKYFAAATGTPLSTFTQAGLHRYEEYWRLGPGDGRIEAVRAGFAGTREALARLLGTTSDELAFVDCTKAGEQVVLDGLPALRAGGNLVTNDLHFGGSLRNLLGRRERGLDLRIVPSVDWRTDVDAMRAAIDDDTALVSVTLLSNINGHLEPIHEIAEIAHAHGAYVYADVIQAAGIVPIDVEAMGIDFAAGNGYKWLFGPHGAGYLYVRQELQGTVLQDRLFPGNAWANYSPWVDAADPDVAPVAASDALTDGRRYEPGHVGYLAYAGLGEGLRFIEQIGVPVLQAHSVALNKRLLEQLDPARYECVSPHVDESPIVTFLVRDTTGLGDRLQAANIAVGNGPAPRAAGGPAPIRQVPRLRISPAIFNTPDDVDALAAALNGA